MAPKPAYLPPPRRFDIVRPLPQREAVKVALDAVMAHATLADADALIDQLRHQGYRLEQRDGSLPA